MAVRDAPGQGTTGTAQQHLQSCGRGVHQCDGCRFAAGYFITQPCACSTLTRPQGPKIKHELESGPVFGQCFGLEFGFWSLVFGFWNFEFGFWNLEFGFWSFDFGFWMGLISVLHLAALKTAVWLLEIGFWSTLDFGVWLSEFGFRSLAFGVWVLEFGCWSLAVGVWLYEFWILEFGCWSLAFGVWILDCGVWLLEFGFWSLEFGVWLLDFGWVLYPLFMWRPQNCAVWILEFGVWMGLLVSIPRVAAPNGALWILELGFCFLAFANFCHRLDFASDNFIPRRLGSVDFGGRSIKTKFVVFKRIRWGTVILRIC